MDRIFIRDLVIRGKHGVLDVEHTRDQEFIVDISIDFDTRKAAESDVLDDTINYDFFRSIAQDVVQGTSFRLIERLADAVAQKILENKRIDRVSVTIRKTEMYDDCTPGVTVNRSRS